MATAVIDCDFDSVARFEGGTTYSQATTGTTIRIRRDGTPTSSTDEDGRIQFRFPLSSLPTGVTVTDSTIQANMTSTGEAAGEDVNVHAYNSTGDDDPNSDTAQQKYDRSIGGSALVQLITGGGAAGSYSADLGATADGQIQGNIDSPDIYSLGMSYDAQWDNADINTFEAIENAGTDPATLTVVYTEPSGAGARLIGSRLVNNSMLVGGRLVA